MPFAAIASAVAPSIIGGLFGDNGAGDAAAASADASRAQLAIANKQEARADEQWQRYKDVYDPLEKSFVADSVNQGSIANQNKAAGQAAADVASKFGGVRQRLSRAAGISGTERTRQGLQTDLAEAATSAGAQTAARDAVVTRGRAALTDAISLGKGLPASSMNGLSSASSLLGAGASGLNTAATFAQTNANRATEGISKVASSVINSAPVQSWLKAPATTDGDYSVGQGAAYGGTTVDGVFTPNRAGM